MSRSPKNEMKLLIGPIWIGSLLYVCYVLSNFLHSRQNKTWRPRVIDYDNEVILHEPLGVERMAHVTSDETTHHPIMSAM